MPQSETDSGIFFWNIGRNAVLLPSVGTVVRVCDVANVTEVNAVPCFFFGTRP